MKTVYKTEDDKEFEDKEKALAYEKLVREKVSIPVRPIEKEVISSKCLKQIFDIGNVYRMTLLLKDEKGTVYEDSDFEIWSLDDTEHLDCSDQYHGLIEWSKTDESYYWTRYGVSKKVELLGIVNVSYI